jgi:hypothetical protein
MQLSKNDRAIPFDWGVPPSSLPSNIPGYAGFDPLGISTLLPIKYLQESEIKHGRAAMLATLGAVVQDVVVDPGYAKIVGGAKLTAAHDAFIKAATGGNKNAWAMQQLLFWIGLFEFITFPAIAEMLKYCHSHLFFSFNLLLICVFCSAAAARGSRASSSSIRSASTSPATRLGKRMLNVTRLCHMQDRGTHRAATVIFPVRRLQLAEIKNGRLAMLAIGGILHHYFITGKGPVQLITGA